MHSEAAYKIIFTSTKELNIRAKIGKPLGEKKVSLTLNLTMIL